MGTKHWPSHKHRSDNSISQDVGVRRSAEYLARYLHDGGFHPSHRILVALARHLQRSEERTRDYLYLCRDSLVTVALHVGKRWNVEKGLPFVKQRWNTEAAVGWKPALDKRGWSDYWASLNEEERRRLLYHKRRRGDP